MENPAEHFYIKRYITSVQEPWEGISKQALAEAACRKVDADRRQKLEGKKQAGAWRESLAAGLLIQRAVADYVEERKIANTDKGDDLQGNERDGLLEIPIKELAEDGRFPLDIHYRYGEHGKPYFADVPLFFSISHSAGSVLCVVSERQVGADIQCVRNILPNGMVERFFSEEEKRSWQLLAEKERADFFYRAWTRKEAYGKLAGDGVLRALDRNLFGERCGIHWEEYRKDDMYIAICVGD